MLCITAFVETDNFGDGVGFTIEVKDKQEAVVFARDIVEQIEEILGEKIEDRDDIVQMIKDRIASGFNAIRIAVNTANEEGVMVEILITPKGSFIVEPA